MGLKALIIEGNVIFRRVVRDLLNGFPDIATVGVASDGCEGLAVIARSRPDIVFVAVFLRDMDGLVLLDNLRRMYPDLKVVVISGSGNKARERTVAALEHGAIGFISKPKGMGFLESVVVLRRELNELVRAVRPKAASGGRPLPTKKQDFGYLEPRRTIGQRLEKEFWCVAIGISAGGPSALRELLPALSADFPLPIIIVQHMPAEFTASLALSLDRTSQVHVKEAVDGEIIRPGVVYVAPGDEHLLAQEMKTGVALRVRSGPKVHGVRPAVDVFFKSLAKIERKRRVLTLIMTGMGRDGTAGLRLLRRSSFYSLTQSEDSCAVYGMPQCVEQAGLSDEVVPLNRLARRLEELVHPVKTSI